MDQKRNKAQDAEAFARVWKRVSPDPEKSPIQCDGDPHAPPSDAFLPLGSCSAVWGDFLRTQISLELTRWRTYQLLSLTSGRTYTGPLATGALGRAKRMAASLFILCDVWYLPQRQATPRTWKTTREGYRLLFRSAQRAEQNYRTAANGNPDPILAELFSSLAKETRVEQRQLLQLLAH